MKARLATPRLADTTWANDTAGTARAAWVERALSANPETVLAQRRADAAAAAATAVHAVALPQIQAAGAMAVLRRDAMQPNLVQTLEHTPAFVHGGPFANIAHGCNSLMATETALKLGDYVVTESGFGSDMGMEKFFHIVCRAGGLQPNAVVLVATVKALKHHAGDPDGGLDAIETGAANLARHLGIVREFGVNPVVAINRFPGDTAEEIYTKLEAFSSFGFPESHSVSFAYLVYSSSWIKYHYCAEFAAALLNAQPMGFYSPHSIVRDARRHGVQVLGPGGQVLTTTAADESVAPGLVMYSQPIGVFVD